MLFGEEFLLILLHKVINEPLSDFQVKEVVEEEITSEGLSDQPVESDLGFCLLSDIVAAVILAKLSICG